MTGPEHYHEAEQLISVTTIPADPDLGEPAEQIWPSGDDIALAQVHATLALAAATALAGEVSMTRADGDAWYAVAASPTVLAAGPAETE